MGGEELLDEERVAAAAGADGGHEIGGGLLGAAVGGDPVLGVAPRHEALEGREEALARDGADAAGEEGVVQALEDLVGGEVGLGVAQDLGDGGVNAGEAEVDAADDVAAGARDGDALVAGLVLGDEIDHGAEDPLVGGAGLGGGAAGRAGLPHRRDAAEVEERGAKVGAREGGRWGARWARRWRLGARGLTRRARGARRARRARRAPSWRSLGHFLGHRVADSGMADKVDRGARRANMATCKADKDGKRWRASS
jgi:hypothetical protein